MLIFTSILYLILISILSLKDITTSNMCPLIVVAATFGLVTVQVSDLKVFRVVMLCTKFNVFDLSLYYSIDICSHGYNLVCNDMLYHTDFFIVYIIYMHMHIDLILCTNARVLIFKTLRKLFQYYTTG